MNVFLSFQKMITPTVITVLYWIGIIACLLGGLFVFIMSIASKEYSGILVAAVIILLGPICVRVHAEFLMILFRIHDVLAEIKSK